MTLGFCKTAAEYKIKELDAKLKAANKKIRKLKAKANIVEKNVNGAGYDGGQCECQKCVDTSIVNIDSKGKCTRKPDEDSVK